MKMQNQTFFVLMFFVMIIEHLNSTGYYFQKIGICDVADRFQQRCMAVITSRSDMDCAVQCMSSANCTGYSMDSNDVCFIHSSCSSIVGCQTTSEDHRYFFKIPKSNPCQNDGTWNSEQETCLCTSGWVGDRCHLYPKSCVDLVLHGYKLYELYDVFLMPENSTQSFRAVCGLFYNSTDIFLFRNEGEMLNFNRTWSEYVNGFSGWTGLKHLKLLFDACDFPECSLRLKFLFDDGTASINKTLRFEYVNPRLGNEASYYRLSYDRWQCLDDEHPLYTSNGCLEQDVPFSAYNQDNDDDTQNCASLTGIGWWYPNCTDFCNPVGKFYTHHDPEPYGFEFIKIPGVDMRKLHDALSKSYLYLHYKY